MRHYPKTSMFRLRFWLLVWDVCEFLGWERGMLAAIGRASAATDWGDAP